MKTDQLIHLLAEDAPVRLRLGRLLWTAWVMGAIAALAILLLTIGTRADLGQALGTIRVIFKIGLTLTFAMAAASVVFRVGRPGASWQRAAWLFAIPLLLVLVATGAELAVLPQGQWFAAMLGRNAGFCVFFVPLLSVPALALFLFALKQGAPESPPVAGAFAGLAAGGVATAVYAWHCPDDSPLFVAVWYVLAIAVITLAGSLLGRRLLAW